MAWYWTCDKPLPEPTWGVRIYIYMCVCVYVSQYIEHTGMVILINYSAYLMLSINLLCLIVGPE